MEQQSVDPQKTTIPPAAMEAILQPQSHNGVVPIPEESKESQVPEPEESPIQDPVTVRLAARDVRTVLDKQKEERQILLTQMNILFVTNTAVLTVLAISRLLTIFTIFNAIEVLLVLLNFILLINALLPRRFVITPVPNDDFLERYLPLSNQDYDLQMLVNLVTAYNANKQTIDDISQTLTYAAYVTLGVIFVAVLHLGTVYFIPELKSP
ncbi:hypothetical protein [Mastigocoleus sp. MO_188.B34]|uniref:hypothetical protein n=1 Tax=Mastigocoleus sp. MO_188.B34 TaxID=3036635 RepID=UPI002631C862|nr:hypothetical protein [Mastigocoleus sp. MO_188.B34]MDJ0693091.1 hypothetical protein [Mastigocoleus sp. MO_188.B34]